MPANVSDVVRMKPPISNARKIPMRHMLIGLMNLKIMFGVLFNVFELINKLRIIASPLNLTAHTTLPAKARAHAT